MGCSSSEFHSKEHRQGQSHPEYEQRALLWLVATKSGGGMAVGRESLGADAAEKGKPKPICRE